MKERKYNSLVFLLLVSVRFFFFSLTRRSCSMQAFFTCVPLLKRKEQPPSIWRGKRGFFDNHNIYYSTDCTGFHRFVLAQCAVIISLFLRAKISGSLTPRKYILIIAPPIRRSNFSFDFSCLIEQKKESLVEERKILT